MSHIRRANPADAARISEIEIFNYRLNFYPIFRNDEFYFCEMRVPAYMREYEAHPERLENTYVYDDGVVKGFVRLDDRRIDKLFVEPVLQGSGIGAQLLDFAVREKQAEHLWALEKNARAIAFYRRNGFVLTDERVPEEDSTEYLVKMEKTI